MAKTSGIVKNSTPVGKSSSSRDSLPDDLDTILVVSSEDIRKARDAVESVTSESETIDCHPVILDENEEATDRFVSNDVSSSGLVAKNPLADDPQLPDVRADKPLPRLGSAAEDDREPDTTTLAATKAPLATMLDDEEEVEISASGLEAVETEGPRATITEIREVEQVITKELEKGLADAIVNECRAEKLTKPADVGPPRAHDDDTATEERPKVRKSPERFDDETMPLPKADLAALGGALETVPLSSAMVLNVIAQVDARAAARASGQPVPRFEPLTEPAQQPAPAPPPPLPSPVGAPMQQPQQGHPPMMAVPVPQPTPQMQARRLGMEIFIALLAFLAVAVPALYYLYFSFSQ